MKKPKTYRHLFFDLDHTLWDFEKNSEETLFHLYDQYKLDQLGNFSRDSFYKKYSFVNQRLWDLYHKGKITQQQLRENRFIKCLTDLGMEATDVPEGISKAFIDLCPTKTAVFPFTHEVLGYLKNKYVLHIITNGFKDVQYIKMKSAKLDAYFSEIITSDCINCTKPDKRIFQHALDRAGVSAQESLMIGDSLEADVLGAMNAGIDQVFFNPEKKRPRLKPTYEVHCLSQLKTFL
ncbi:YjjG family noncanonical pyrimidine nucleotidase [Rufibacter hautae]|uniref:Noncanonical pyrimidine nucleotidase, YjjG family n=1 Tax=Rufibacter hautae TaxID=2595005 RepID=A0A5B6TJZ0_9BACT|nr:YjjG family noncanonical pyrimidine nucleotidase [Rufibacter hautae]KAA3439770.1 noncanonical pyrimidine nucleotidase, YjjG family [Rufibacter hautae]